MTADPGAHYLRQTLRQVIAYPAHGPRDTDPQQGVFEHARRHLIYNLKTGCWIGGATIDQIRAGLPESHRCHGATQLEAHHAVAEFAGLNEEDWQKVAKDFPQAGIHSDEDFKRFANSEGGLTILCDIHHRDAGRGIHMVSYPAWLLDKYAKDDWEFLVPGAK
jgi:hypothetical protein